VGQQDKRVYAEELKKQIAEKKHRESLALDALRRCLNP
jgi:hypothetical protein